MRTEVIGDATLHLGDCMDVLKTIADESVDSIVCDPPYHLTQASRGGHARTNNPGMPHGRHRIGDKGFMGKVWDGGDIAHRVEMWAECLRVLKPGGHLLAFAATRTYHRMTCAIEDAGFEIRDMVPWHYASGFPKSRNLDGDWSGWGTALKPATEPICMGRKPLIGTVAANVGTYGTGAINIDGCRVPTDDSLNGGAYASDGGRATLAGDERTGAALGMFQPGKTADREYAQPTGRWPANVIHDGSPEVLEAFPDALGQMADASYIAPSPKTSNVYGAMKRVGEASQDERYVSSGGTNFAMKPGARRLDTGSAARFFKQIETDDSEWAIPNPLQLNAHTADQNLSLQNVVDAIAQNAAATSALPAGTLLSALPAPSMTVTATESKMLSTAVIAAILNSGPKFLREWRQERLSPSSSPVSVVATRAPTGTMMITASHWSSDGSAAPVTFSITPRNLEVGAKASRPSSNSSFIYCAKASRTDRNEGVGGSDQPAVGTEATMRDRETADWQERNGNFHPTVKPTDLMAYLCRLVTPPGGLVLDPFMGSGSTGKAAMREGFRFIGIDMTPEYVAIAEARIRFEQEKIETQRIEASRQTDMFTEVA